LLGQYVENVRPGLLPEDLDPEDRTQPLVFNERRRPFERTGLYRRVVRILTGAGLGDRASVQLLRHTYGYLAYLRTGGNLLFVQRQLGHAHPRITSVYAQLVEESYAEMAERVAGEAELAAPTSEKRVYEQCRPEFDCEID
jgi:site-specific recombinase XerD